MLDPASLALTALTFFAQDPSAKARQLFITNCATCHGETGDGKGVTQLDRPARSFMDGGFSFGNTPEQLFRTISTGIPGTPMPGFEESMSEADRKLVADYVVTLGPPIEEVKEEDMNLEVLDRPLVVRGLLPSLGEGLPEHPRGLLMGYSSGTTFEYAVDDVRLLAVRQGGFVRRTDWSGRGGTPLEPLGKVATLVEGGRPAQTFSLAAGARPLEARLSGTRVEGERAFVGYHLLARGMEVAHVEESPGLRQSRAGTGYSRHFRITAARPVHLALADPTQIGEGGDERIGKAVMYERDGFHCMARRDGEREFHDLRFATPRWTRKWGVLILDLARGERVDVITTVYPIEVWDEAMTGMLDEIDEAFPR